MSYRDAIHRLYALRSRGIKLDLDRVSEASHILGDPHREMGRVIQIAGTNGKGSTAAMIDRIVREAGLRSGFFSSPHLHRFGERIVVDGTPLADDVLEPRILEILGRQDDGSMPELSFFEIATLLAFEAFRDAGTDVAVLEVGLGGRLDATNVADADVAVITRVAHDHGSILGHELSQIAAEKAGIISRGKPVVSTRQDPRARAVLEAVAAERDAPLSILGRDFQVRPTRAGVHSFVDVVVGDETVRGLSLGLEGSHQVDNAACAVAAVIALRDAGISIDHGAIAGGLEKTRWPGRLERIEARPTVLLDVAHNPDGCCSLAAYLATQPRRPRALVFGAMRDKDHEAMLRPLEGVFAHRIWTRPKMERAEEPVRFATLSYGEVIRDVGRAVRHAQRVVGKDGEVVVAGSAFVVAEARAMLLDLANEPPIGL